MKNSFLPISTADLAARGWEEYDFLVVSADAYVDHPSFGAAIIARVLEAEGFRVAFLAQPNVGREKSFTALGRPRFAAFISGGNLDSMVAHYSVAKRRREQDYYSPGGKMGYRPDRPTIVYSQKFRQLYPDLPLIIGGLEGSLRRFAHYDYWDDAVRPCILADSNADLLTYGMGEKATVEIAHRLASGAAPWELTDIRGTAYLADHPAGCPFPKVDCPSFEQVAEDKKAYAKANIIQYEMHDPVRGKAVLQRHGEHLLVVNPPMPPLEQEELDRIYELPYMRDYHPTYNGKGGIPAIEEVKFSITHNRGCFGACNFCSLAFHQGRVVTSRSHESVLREATAMVSRSDFKGYIHDVGGPTANFRRPSCEKQKKHGLCAGKACLSPVPCPNIDGDHSDYLALLRKLRKISGIKKVFIRSGIRFDYLMLDKSGEFFSELVKYHVSGQLKVAPEHCAAATLDYMGKPSIETYERFREKYKQLNQKHGFKQFLVPYLMSSHPGCSLDDAVRLAEWLNKEGVQPEQVQDFYPTPGTLSTCMFYTGFDPRTMQPVFVPKRQEEKAMQRALMQWKRPEKRDMVLKALYKTGRTDLIGFEKHCLVRPNQSKRRPESGKGEKPEQRSASGRQSAGGKSQVIGKPQAASRPKTGGKPKAGKKPKGKPKTRNMVKKD